MEWGLCHQNALHRQFLWPFLKTNLLLNTCCSLYFPVQVRDNGTANTKYKLKVQGEVNFMDSVRLKKGLASLMNMYLAPLRSGRDADALAMNIAGLQL